MTLEEQIKNTLLIFKNHPKESGQRRIKIEAQILKENRLDTQSFWNVICPMLKKEGVLKKYSKLFEVEIIDQEKYNKISSRLVDIKNKEQQKQTQQDLSLVTKHFYNFEIDQEKLERFYLKYHPTNINDADFSIILDSGENTLTINSDVLFFAKETLERVMIDLLVERKTEISWDEILDIYDGKETVHDVREKKVVGDARDRINRKVKATVLKDDLISRRANNYKLKREVTKK